MLVRVSFVVFATCAASCFADAASTVPASTSRPAATASGPAVTLDFSTPAKAYLTFSRAMAARDIPALTGCIAWENNEDRKRFVAQTNATTEDLYGQRELCNFMLEHFPNDEAVKKLSAYGKRLIDAWEIRLAEQVAIAEKALDSVTIKEDADTATVTPVARGNVTRLKKIAGKWLVLPESIGLRADRPDPDADRNVKLLERMKELQAAEIEKFKADVKAGKYATGQEALDAINKAGTRAREQAQKEFPPPQ